MGGTFLPDHAHHQRASRYWYEQSADRLAFCRVTALLYLRLTTNRVVMAGRPLTAAQAWQSYLAFRHLPEVILLKEPVGCEELLGQWATGGERSPRQWTDAFLAAFASAGQLRLVTLDADFKRFPELDLLHLVAG